MIYYPALLATPVPRYTSYPTAADFHDRIGSADMAVALASVAHDAPISLYVHIPFCRQICWYCGCNTGNVGRGDRLAAYLDRLRAEIAVVAAHLGSRGRVTRIAFGGGSPNAVAAGDFAALLATLRTSFAAADALVSVEIDPRGFDAEWAAMLGRNGVTRASLGVQTFSPAIQAAIGRVQPQAMIESAVALLRDAGVTSLNFDLMYGLPGQRAADLADTLARAIVMAPDRLAVFGYAHVPQMISRQRRIDASDLPDSEQRFAQAALADRMLGDAGYQAIGFDHFALPHDPLAVAARAGRLHRNFQGFTDDDAVATIGLGVSAISAFADRLIQNDKHNGRYHAALDAGLFPAALGCHRDDDDRFRGQLITSILGQGHGDAGLLAADPDVRRRLAPFETAGLLRWHGTRIELTATAMPYARSVAAVFDRYRAGSAAGFSRAV
jgi:oxygen-independent coproporphyrinogen-3 oxidase